MTDLLERLRRERRVAFIFFAAFMAVAIAVQYLGGCVRATSGEASPIAPVSTPEAAP